VGVCTFGTVAKEECLELGDHTAVINVCVNLGSRVFVLFRLLIISKNSRSPAYLKSSDPFELAVSGLPSTGRKGVSILPPSAPPTARPDLSN
jgi:hypothetical protein